jgi:hypothetical protein
MSRQHANNEYYAVITGRIEREEDVSRSDSTYTAPLHAMLTMASCLDVQRYRINWLISPPFAISPPGL